jgi:hypothetical protein
MEVIACKLQNEEVTYREFVDNVYILYVFHIV